MTNKEKIKKFIKETFGDRFESEDELEQFAQKLLESAEKTDLNIRLPSSKVWKKEEIEELGIVVTPVKWKKLE